MLDTEFLFSKYQTDHVFWIYLTIFLFSDRKILKVYYVIF